MSTPEAAPDVPLTVTFSTDKRTFGVVSIFDNVSAVKALRVPRDFLNRTPDEWKTGCGFYILASHPDSDGSFYAYVGKATQNNLYSRISSHRREKEDWDYAFLFQRDTTNGLNSTQAAYAEGEIQKQIAETDKVTAINIATAGDKTLPDHDVFYMSQVVRSALRIMAIFGYQIGDEFKMDKPGTHGIPTRANRYYGVTITKLVKSGLLAEGERVFSVNEKYPGTTTIGHGGLLFQDGEFKPSRAAMELVKSVDPGNNKAQNGWTFWAVERSGTTVTLADVRDDYLNKKHLYETSMLTEKDIDFEKALSSNEKKKVEAQRDPNRHAESRVVIAHLLDAELIYEGVKIKSLDSRYPYETVIENGGIIVESKICTSPRIATKTAQKLVDPNPEPTDGWGFWAVEVEEGQFVPLAEVLDEYMIDES